MKCSQSELVELARKIRRHSVEMTHLAKASHVGSSLSMAEILVVLYREVLRVDPEKPLWPRRDRLILSKGHACAALYAVLAESGFFPVERLQTFYKNGSTLAGHVTHRGVPGVEASTGSLGHGLSLATGMALAARRGSDSFRVFCVLSDGECDEGSTWEPALFASQHELDNLVAVVDYNKIQSLGSVREVLDLEPFAEKWSAFGWEVEELDGHDVQSLADVLSGVPFKRGRPSCVIAHTVKGKGVSFMEDRLLWHYRTPQGDEYLAALAELESSE